MKEKINIVGQRFGRLLVLNQVENLNYYKCQCDCGTIITIFKYQLTNKIRGTKSCGCLIREAATNKRKDLVGQKFGELIVVEYMGSVKRADTTSTRAIYKVKCSCGTEKEVRGEDLITKNTISCGHIAKERLAKGMQTTHGLSKHPLYNRLHHMIERCEKENHPSYKDYGAKGIYVSEPWRSNPQSFIDWFEENRNKNPYWMLEVDRYPDKLGPYAPWNCRLVTSEVNNNNRTNNRIETAFGTTDSLANLVKKFGKVSYGTVQVRLSMNWDIESALTFLPGQKYRNQARNKKTNVIYTFLNDTACLAELVEKYSEQPYGTVLFRLKKGWNIEKALKVPNLGDKYKVKAYESKFGAMAEPYLHDFVFITTLQQKGNIE